VTVLTLSGGEQGGVAAERAVESRRAAEFLGARLVHADLVDTSVSEGGTTIATIKSVIDEMSIEAFRLLWFVSLATYLFITLSSFSLDWAAARVAWREAFAFPGLISLLIIVYAMVPDLVGGVGGDAAARLGRAAAALRRGLRADALRDHRERLRQGDPGLGDGVGEDREDRDGRRARLIRRRRRVAGA
jgi:hypothetical protein